MDVSRATMFGAAAMSTAGAAIASVPVKRMPALDRLHVLPLLLGVLFTSACVDRAQRVDAMYGADGWKLTKPYARQYTFDAHGQATGPAGADVALGTRAVRFDQYGWAGAITPLDRRSAHRIRVTGELRGSDVGERASIWLRAQGAARRRALIAPLVPIHGTTEWTSQSAEAFAPQGATNVAYGILLQGNGDVFARGLRIEVQPVPPPGTPLTPVAARELDSAIALVRKYSLWRDTVTWPVVERDVRTAAAGAESPEDVYPAIRILLAALGDHHSYFIPPAEQQMLQRGTGAIVADVRALGDSVGYVAIPGYMEADRERTRAYVSRVYAGLEQFASTARCGWIVDLRRNTGGIGTPMLGALLPFLGRGLLGGNVLPIRGDSAPITWTQRWVAMDWMVQNGVDVTPPADLSALDTAYVAVITGPLTGSAGEIVTLAFHGRPHTRSFGEPTAGATTGGAVFALPDGARLAISAALYADRTGRSYDGPIQPDQLVPVGSAADGDEDAPIAAAERWLARSTGCNITAPHIGS